MTSKENIIVHGCVYRYQVIAADVLGKSSRWVDLVIDEGSEAIGSLGGLLSSSALESLLL